VVIGHNDIWADFKPEGVQHCPYLTCFKCKEKKREEEFDERGDEARVSRRTKFTEIICEDCLYSFSLGGGGFGGPFKTEKSLDHPFGGGGPFFAQSSRRPKRKTRAKKAAVTQKRAQNIFKRFADTDSDENDSSSDDSSDESDGSDSSEPPPLKSAIEVPPLKSAIEVPNRGLLNSTPRFVLGIWNVTTGRLEQALEPTSKIRDCFFRPDGESIVSCHHDATLKIWAKDPPQL
jgi:hypothetical protein